MASGLGVMPVAGTRLRQLAGLIAGSPHNLVSRRERTVDALNHHLVEAAAVGSRLNVGSGQRWMDLGTGGGIPGLVLAMSHPGVEWVLVDSVAKKALAVEAFAAELDLGNVTVVAARAENLAREAAHRGAFHGVVARAVAPLPVLAELARGFVRPGGVLAAVKGPSWREEADLAAGAMQRLGWRDLVAAPVDEAPRPTWVVSVRAEGEVPAWVPRADGVPGRNPLR